MVNNKKYNIGLRDTVKRIKKGGVGAWKRGRNEVGKNQKQMLISAKCIYQTMIFIYLYYTVWYQLQVNLLPGSRFVFYREGLFPENL